MKELSNTPGVWVVDASFDGLRDIDAEEDIQESRRVWCVICPELEGAVRALEHVGDTNESDTASGGNMV